MSEKYFRSIVVIIFLCLSVDLIIQLQWNKKTEKSIISLREDINNELTKLKKADEYFPENNLYKYPYGELIYHSSSLSNRYAISCILDYLNLTFEDQQETHILKKKEINK